MNLDKLDDLNDELRDIAKREQIINREVVETFTYKSMYMITWILKPYYILTQMKLLTDFNIERLPQKKIKIVYNCKLSSEDLKVIIEELRAKENYNEDVIRVLDCIINSRLKIYERM